MTVASGAPAPAWIATAPTRICDAGGWTDTWFARHGRVVNVAVAPRAVATVTSTARRGDRPQVRMLVRDFDDDYGFELDGASGRHPLLEQSVVAAAPPAAVMLDVEVSCAAPAGASMGTSAAVVVALIGALDAALHDGPTLTADDAAARAHEVETVRVGRQAGIQDQLAAAHGGACDIRIDGYPRASVSRIALPARLRDDLERSLLTIYLGSHDSSGVHQEVIAALEDEGERSPRLQRLRETAAHAAAALTAGDLVAYANALTANTDAQADLHPGIVGSDAASLIDLARLAGAIGWKVNGAGGTGGSVTIVCPPARPSVREAIASEVSRRSGWTLIETRPTAVGLRVRRVPDANEGRPKPPLVN